MADFLANYLIPVGWELIDKFFDEKVFIVEFSWLIHFDRPAHRDKAGAGVIFYIFQADKLPYSFTLTCQCSNNVAKYQTLILELEMTIDTK